MIQPLRQQITILVSERNVKRVQGELIRDTNVKLVKVGRRNEEYEGSESR